MTNSIAEVKNRSFSACTNACDINWNLNLSHHVPSGNGEKPKQMCATKEHPVKVRWFPTPKVPKRCKEFQRWFSLDTHVSNNLWGSPELLKKNLWRITCALGGMLLGTIADCILKWGGGKTELRTFVNGPVCLFPTKRTILPWALRHSAFKPICMNFKR